MRSPQTKWRSYAVARKFVRKLKLRRVKDWSAYCQGRITSKYGPLPADIPPNPAVIYAFDGWKGFDHWLDTGQEQSDFPTLSVWHARQRGKSLFATYVRASKLTKIVKMARLGLDDELWARLQPALAKCPRRTETRGKGRFTDRDHLIAVVAIAMSGLPWQRFPARFRLGHGLTCQKRFLQWFYFGAWDLMEPILRTKYPDIPAENWDYLRSTATGLIDATNSIDGRTH